MINIIITNIIANLYKKKTKSDIDADLGMIVQPTKDMLLGKKQQNITNSIEEIAYDMITMTEHHIPFFDPFLSVDYDIPSTKRKLFSSKVPLLSPTQRKALNLDVIKTRISNISETKLFKPHGGINRDHILSILLDAMSFPKNENIIEYLCDLLKTRDNLNLIDIIINKKQNITDYLFLNDEYRKYAVYLLVYYYKNQKFNDILDSDANYYLEIFNTKILDDSDIQYTEKKSSIGEWDIFFNVLIYNLTKYITGNEDINTFTIYLKNVTKITELIGDKLSRELKSNIIKTFQLKKFSEFTKLSHEQLIENYLAYHKKKRADMLSKIHFEGGKKIKYKTFTIKKRQVSLKQTTRKTHKNN
jgi:hypothetical protein